MQFRGIKHWALAALAGAGILGVTVKATAAVVPDFSFEKTALADGANGGALNVGTNWSAGGNTAAVLGGVYLSNPTDAIFAGTTGDLNPLPATADGTNCLFMSLASSKAYAWQDMGTLQSNTTYTLTAALGLSLTGSSGVGKIALVNGVDPFGIVLAARPIDSSLITPGSFVDSNVVFTTGQQVSGHLTLVLQGESGTELIFDNIRLDATATPPAPTTFTPTASPSNTVYAGTTTVTLSEDPAGTAPFHFQWQSDNGGGGASFSDISGANNSAYAVNTTGFTPGAPVLYRVVVTNSFGGSTSSPVTLTVITGPPVVTVDTLPATGSDVVGSKATFTAAFAGSLPISYQWQRDGTDLSGATNATLTITNLQVTDGGSYSLRASNILGVVVFSTASQFTVNPVPDPVDGLVTAIATQTGNGNDVLFSPTWAVSPNSLIAGAAPSNVGLGDFSANGWGTVAVLTDGQSGRLNSPGNGSPDFVTAGINEVTSGASVTYTLAGSASGYDLTNIVVYGGWSAGDHDQQRYIIHYSTTASPTTFNQLATVDFNPVLPGLVPSVTRVTLTATNGVLAKNVAAVKVVFNILQPPVVEGGYAGYSEIGLSGVPSAPAPVVAKNISPLAGSDVEGSEVTFTAAFTSDTPMTLQWRTDKGSGPVAIPGATNTTLTLSNLQLSDSGSYSLQASNASGTSLTSSSAFVVNPVPAPDGNGVIASPANQIGAAPFSTTWTVATNTLISGTLPTSIGTGNFSAEGSGGVKVLTDGRFGAVGGGNNSTRATCGSGAGGRSTTYTLPANSSSGYNISNIVVYSGWNDGGRDQQAYTVYYSTVDAPDTFILLTSVDYNPTVPTGTPTATRITINSSTAAPLASNVARVQFDFSSPAGENGYTGYPELGIFGALSAPMTFGPFLVQDTLPVTGSDVVGSQVTLTAQFSGSPTVAYQWRKDTGAGPADIPGATSAALTLVNLQLSDTANPGYSVQASNEFGVLTSTPSPFTVNPAPAPVNNIITAIATQTGKGIGNVFTPTWLFSPGSLIAGAGPSSVGTGNFGLDSSGGVAVLTDGKFGVLNPPGVGSLDLVTCGPNGGRSITYTLTGSTAGYDLNTIVFHGGWSDGGRDQQSYAVSYSTAANPTNFIPLTSVSYNPTLPGTVQSATRSTLTSAIAGPLATHVAAVRFDFTQAVENNYAGYSEVGLFGVPSAPPLTIDSARVSGGNLILTGSGGTPNGSYTRLTTTNVAAPLATWTTNSTGVFSGTGSFSNAIPINPSEAARFFTIRIP